MSIIPNKDSLVKWTEKKKQAAALAARLQHIGGNLYARGCRMAECGQFIVQSVCPSCGEHHGTTAKLCRDRLCPICGWRLSLARFAQMLRVLDLAAPILKERRVYAQMLTLTVKNVKLGQLGECLKTMSQGWGKLRRRAIFKGVIGWAKNTEITFNEKTREAHPHIHVILLWDGDYTEKAQDFARHVRVNWKDCIGADYNPIVDARRCYAKHDSFCYNDDAENAVKAAAIEASKYCVKGSDLGNLTDSELDVFAQQIHRYRFCEYGGIIKKIRGELGLNDEDYNAETKVKCTCGAHLVQVVAAWNGSSYVVSSVKAVLNDAE